MNIGFDAKRAFHNKTGLGNYSRTLISSLAEYYPQHHYYLFNPKPSHLYPKADFSNIYEILPQKFLSKKFSSFWRSSWVKKDLKKLDINLYHGLSHEIPTGIQKTGIPSVVTIHDLIFEHYPKQYSPIDVRIHHHKIQYACNHANRIIAISQQTRQDIVDLYGIEEDKIDICYQSCHPAFSIAVSELEKALTRKKYHLPPEFYLYVGSIIERKNLLNICKALAVNKHKNSIPLVVIGEGKAYKQKVQEFISEHNLSGSVLFLSETVKGDAGFQKPETIAVIYQMATAMLYPSFYEGFGIPVLEALWSRLPVITSNVSCLPETGGDAAYYVNPDNSEDIAEAMLKVHSDLNLRQQMIKKGERYAQNFTLEKCARSVMNVYKKIV